MENIFSEKNKNADKARKAMIDYYGTATAIYPLALIDVAEIEKMSDDAVIYKAKKLGVKWQ